MLCAGIPTPDGDHVAQIGAAGWSARRRGIRCISRLASARRFPRRAGTRVRPFSRCVAGSLLNVPGLSDGEIWAKQEDGRTPLTRIGQQSRSSSMLESPHRELRARRPTVNRLVAEIEHLAVAPPSEFFAGPDRRARPTAAKRKTAAIVEPLADCHGATSADGSPSFGTRAANRAVFWAVADAVASTSSEQTGFGLQPGFAGKSNHALLPNRCTMSAAVSGSILVAMSWTRYGLANSGGRAIRARMACTSSWCLRIGIQDGLRRGVRRAIGWRLGRWWRFARCDRGRCRGIGGFRWSCRGGGIGRIGRSGGWFCRRFFRRSFCRGRRGGGVLVVSG